MAHPPQADTPFRLFWNEFRSSHLALGALSVVVLIITLAVLAWSPPTWVNKPSQPSTV